MFGVRSTGQLIISGTLNGDLASNLTGTTYTYSVEISGGCGNDDNLIGFIHVNADSEIGINTTGDENQIICEGDEIDPIVFQIGGGASGAVLQGKGIDPATGNVIFDNNLLPSGISGSYNATTREFTIEGEITESVIYDSSDPDGTQFNYRVITTGNACATTQRPEVYIDGTISIQPKQKIELISPTSTDNQIVCEGEAIDQIQYQLSEGADYYIVTPSLPTGLSPNFDTTTKVFSISGSISGITTQQVFSYEITTIGDPNSTNACPDTISGSITVNPDPEIILISTSNSDVDVCEGQPMDEIKYQLTGGALGAVVSGLPSGVQYTIDPGTKIVTISGTPSQDVSSEETYYYSITTIGSLCPPEFLYVGRQDNLGNDVSGKITIKPDGEITLTSANKDQTICEGDDISDITFNIAGGATGAYINWLGQDPGFDFDPTTLTLSGTFSNNISVNTTYDYEVITTGSGCQSTIISGSITVNAGPELELQSGGLNQTLCEQTPIQPITVGWSGGATDAIVSGLPAGLIVNRIGSSLTISGTLETDEIGISETTYNYTITSVGGCGDPIVLNGGVSPLGITGTITVKPGPNIEITSGNATQEVCFGNPIDNIEINVENTLIENIIVTGLPQGVSYNKTSGKIVGEPTQSVTTRKTYRYKILSSGSECIEVILDDPSQTISVIPNGTLDYKSGLIDTDSNNIADQTPLYCEGVAISPIIYNLSEGADGVEILNLPDGIEGSFNASTREVTISGTLNVVVDQDTDTPADGLVNRLVYEVEIIPTSSTSPCDQISQSFDFVIVPDPLKNLENSINVEYCNGSLVGDIDGDNIISGKEFNPIKVQLYSNLVEDGGIDPYVTVSGLPNGLFSLFNETTNEITIKGVIDESTPGDFDIEIETFGACSSLSPVNLGTISVLGNITYELNGLGEENQIICFGNNIIPINYQLTGVLGSTNIQIDWTDSNGNLISPPSGISVTPIADILSSGKIDISGTYNTLTTSEPAVLNYEIQLLEGICSTYINGTLEFKPEPKILESILDDHSFLSTCSDDSYINLGYLIDADGDGIADIIDSDDDNDGIVDRADIDNNPTKDDTDQDGIIDAADIDLTLGTDSNTNGIDDLYENDDTSPSDGIIDLVQGGTDSNGDGINDNFDFDTINNSITTPSINHVVNYSWSFAPDTDKDGIVDVADADLDNDGVTDPGKIDFDADGIIDTAQGGIDTNLDGVDDDYLSDPANNAFSLFSLQPNISSLNEGIYKVRVETITGCPVERQFQVISSLIDVSIIVNQSCNSTGSIEIDSIEPTGTYEIIWYEFVDTDSDGIADAHNEITGTSNTLILENLTAGEFRVEVREFGSTTCSFIEDISLTDNNFYISNIAIDNAVSCSTKIDPITGKIMGSVSFDVSSPDIVVSYLIYKATDDDNDGIVDLADADLDNDGLTDSGEFDTDNDGIIDAYDSDIDGDGIEDVVDIDQNPGSNDTDNDNIIDAADVDETGGIDSNGDGIDDSFVIDDNDRDGIKDSKKDELRNAALSDTSPSTATLSSTPTSTDYSDTLDLIPGTYVIETVYANSVTNQCNVSDVFTIINDAVEFSQNVLDDIKSDLASCSNTKSIDLLPTSGPILIFNSENINSYIWYYAVDTDLDGIVDVVDLDQNPGSGDVDLDGVIDPADVDLTGGTDLNLDGVDDDYLNDPSNNAFKLFGTGSKIQNLSNGIYRVSIEISPTCTITEDFTVTTSELKLEIVTEDVSCGNLGSITIESIEPVGAYDVYWHDISDNDLDGVIDVYQQLLNSDITSMDIIPDIIDIDQNPGSGDADLDDIIDAADVDQTGGTDNLISGIDDDYLLENILRLNLFNNLFSISNLNPGNYRLLIENSGQNGCVLAEDITILSDEFTLDNVITTDASICSSIDVVSGLRMGEVAFDIDGTYLIDNYILYKALDSDNDGYADIMDVDHTVGTDTDNDGIIDEFDSDFDGDGSIDSGKADQNGDGIDDYKENELRNAALSDTSPSILTPSPTPTSTTYSDSLSLVPGTYVMAIEYSNADTSGCDYIIDQSVFTISYYPVEFDQDALDLIRAELVGCSATKTIDFSIPGVISNTQMIDSYIWYYAADSDYDGIVDAVDLDQNAGSGDADADGIIDAADVDLTGGTDSNFDGVDDDYLNEPSNNAFSLFGSGNLVENLSNGIYKVSIETVNGCIIEESFDVSSSQFDVETTVINQTCGEQGSIAIESISPVGAYDIYWHDISDNDLDGIIDVYQKLNDVDGDGIADLIDIDQNATSTNSDGPVDDIIDVADVDSTGGTDTLIAGIDDDYLLENILRLNSFNNLFSINDLNAGIYRLEIQVAGSNECAYRDDFTISSDEYSISNISTINAISCSVNPVTLLTMGSVTFDIDGTYMLDSYLLYKALDTDNDGIADIIDIDQTGGLDSDNDGIIDAADVDQTGGVDTNGDGIDDSYNIQLSAAAMADTSPLSVPVDLDKDDDGIADNVDVDQTGGNDSDGDGIDDFADVNQTGGIDLNGDGIDDSIIANPNPTSTPYTDTIDLIPGSYAIELVYSNPNTSGCTYTIEDVLFTIFLENPSISLSNISTKNATICSDVDPVTSLTMGSVTFDIDGTYMLDSYLLYKALDTDNDGIADIIDIDQAGGLDSDNDGIIDAADADQTGGIDTNGDGIDDSYNIQLSAAAMADTSPLSVPVDLDKDDDGIADNVDVDQTGGNDSDGDGIDDFADVNQTGVLT